MPLLAHFLLLLLSVPTSPTMKRTPKCATAQTSPVAHIPASPVGCIRLLWAFKKVGVLVGQLWGPEADLGPWIDASGHMENLDVRASRV